MSIAALPSNTVQAIGSSQALTDSASVVKELIDNALDGRATAIFVEISTNTLDIIQVRDNGHGIIPGDRCMLGRRYCTSKIRDLEDLANIGGQSLGFRGEALASAAELSGSVVITTRVEGEPTATSVKVKRQGGIESEEKTAHPTGTTVRVVDFLKSIPVRRQTILKGSTKLLFKTKRLIQAYALARPTIRFSLKVLKAKNDKGNWIYAPKNGAIPEAVLTNATMQVVGKKVVEQSKWTAWSPSSFENRTGNAETEADKNNVYKIQALLPTPVYDPSSVNNNGQFVSIDSRPISCARGILKQMIDRYKSYLRSAKSPSNGQNVVDPFLYMNIICPQGSYDVNVEPAKDDVLFTNDDLFLKVIEDFFMGFYGEPKVKETEGLCTKPAKPRSQVFELLLARKPPPRVNVTQNQANEGSDIPKNHEDTSCTVKSICDKVDSISSMLDSETSSVFETLPRHDRGYVDESTRMVEMRPWKRNMYNVGDDAVEDSHLPVNEQSMASIRSEIDDEDALRDVTVSNPWAFAKMNASTRPLREERAAETAINTDGQLFTPVRQRGEASDGPSLSDSHDQLDGARRRELPTPESSGPIFSSTPALQCSSPEPFPYPLKAWGKEEGRRAARKAMSDRERYASGALDTWVQKSLDSQTNTPTHDEADLIGANSTNANGPRGFESARNLPMGTPLNKIPEATIRPTRKPGQRKQQQQAGVSRPFANCLNDSERVWFDVEPKRRIKAARRVRSENGMDIISIRGPICPNSEGDDSTLEVSSSAASVEAMHPDLASIMDYEHRKQAALEHRKKYLRKQAAAATKILDQNSLEIPSLSQNAHISPHKHRYNKAIAALHPACPPATERSPAFEPTDPRAYFIRTRQREDAEHLSNPNTAGVSLVRKRRKTAMLPLESVKEDWSTRDLVLKLEVIFENIREKIEEVAGSDSYITTGNTTDALSESRNHQIAVWEEKLSCLLKTKYRKTAEKAVETGGNEAEMSIDLQMAMRAHVETYYRETI